MTAPDEETSKASLKRPVDEVKQTKAHEKIGCENKKRNEMESEENNISKLNEMWINITEHLAHTAITLDKDDYGDNKIETLVVDLENKKEHNQENKSFYERKPP